MYNPRDFATIRLPRHGAGTTHFSRNLVSTVPLSCSLFLCVSVNVRSKFSEVWFIVETTPPPPSLHFFPTMPTGKTDSPKSVWACVCAFAHVCVWASVNPFCQALAQSFLSKLPAWSWSPLVLVEEGLEEKACGTPAAPRPGPRLLHPQWPGLGFGVCRGSVWQLWLTLQSPLPRTPQFNPTFPFTPRKRGEKDNYTHIQQPTSPPVCPQSCISDVQPFTTSIQKKKEKRKEKSGKFACVLRISPPSKQVAN